MQRAEQSTLWITASEDGASATCVGVAPACNELRSGPNKSEREPTSARSTNYGSGHLIPAFHGTGRTFSLLPSHPLDAASRSMTPPWSRAWEAKFPGQRWFRRIKKGFNCVSCGTHRGGRASRASFTPKREPRPSPPRWGAGSREPSFGGVRRALVTRAPFANSRARPKLPHGTSCCGIFATLGEYFSPITLLGDFPVRMSQLEHVGGRAHGSRDDSIDCDSGVRCRFCAGPLGRQARPLRRCEIEEGTVSDFTSAPNQACCLVGHDAPLPVCVVASPRPPVLSPRRAGRSSSLGHDAPSQSALWRSPGPSIRQRRVGALTRSAPCMGTNRRQGCSDAH